MKMLPKVGLIALFATIALAPLLGGTPIGYAYAAAAFGGDSMLGAVRALLLVAALLLLLFDSRNVQGSAATTRIASFAVWAGFALTLLSLLVHSAFLTSPVLLFAMLPDTLSWLSCALAFTLALRHAGDDRAALWAAVALTVGGALGAVLGVLAFGGVPAAERAAFRGSATFFSPNFAAGFFGLVLPVAVALFVSEARRSLLATVASGAACALMFGALISTGSRAGVVLALVGLIVALVLALLTSRRQTEGAPFPWPRVGVLLAILLIMGFLFRAPLIGRATGAAAAGGTVATSGDQGHSQQFRKETWKGTIKMATAHPLLGTGPGTFPYRYPPYATVGWTGLAHSSYLEVAGEQGFPALIAYLIALGAALLSGLTRAFSPSPTGEAGDIGRGGRGGEGGETLSPSPLLLCGLLGGLVAATGRGLFDSEWALLGNALPFWFAAGLAAGWGTSLIPATRTNPLRYAAGAGVAVALIMTLILRSGNATRDGIMAANPAEAHALAQQVAGTVWPPDSQLYATAGDAQKAAQIEPSGKRYFQLARTAEAHGDDKQAIALYQQSLAAEPNNLQTRKRFAEALERSRDHQGALNQWQEMVKLSQGPVGQVRAIPELPDTLPAFAFTALADEATKQQNWTEAERQYHEAQTILEEYSHTPPVYQQTELMTLNDPEGRRAEIRSLYEHVIAERQTALRRLDKPADAAALDTVKQETLARLDAFLTKEQLMRGASGTGSGS